MVLGTTASGKTRMACTIAGMLPAEIISADSRQVYRHLDIGTGKDLHEYGKIPYHLIGIADPAQKYYLHHFLKDLRAAFHDIRFRDKLPIICGGSGLYLDALRKDFSMTGIGEDPLLRAGLGLLDRTDLEKRLNSYPQHLTRHVDRSSLKRMIRGIEIAEHASVHGLPAKSQNPFAPYYIGIEVPAEQLKTRISDRLRIRLDGGLLEEVESLLRSGLTHQRLEELGLEYRHASQYLRGLTNYHDFVKGLETAIQQFARRQRTWFRKMEKEGVSIRWFPPAVSQEQIRDHLKTIFTQIRNDTPSPHQGNA